MSNSLSPEVLAQLFAQESRDPFLTLVTMTNSAFTARLVNNSRDITSRGFTFTALPMRIRLPVDDGETARDFNLVLDNVSLDLISNIRQVTTTIGVKFEMILASIPNVVQMSFEDLSIVSFTYNSTGLTARIVMDSFLNIEMTSERYMPTLYPGLF